MFLGLWVTKPAILISLIHILRCLMFAVAVVCLGSSGYMQILALLVPTLLMLALVLRERHHIWRDRLIWTLHLGNETAIYLTCVFLILFSLYVPGTNDRKLIGWAFLGLIGITITLNFVIIITYTFMRWRVCCRKRKSDVSQKVLV